MITLFGMKMTNLFKLKLFTGICWGLEAVVNKFGCLIANCDPFFFYFTVWSSDSEDKRWLQLSLDYKEASSRILTVSIVLNGSKSSHSICLYQLTTNLLKVDLKLSFEMSDVTWRFYFQQSLLNCFLSNCLIEEQNSHHYLNC